jgi:Ni/Fe-hydrogenase subunit HybB-like protein
MEVFFGWYSQNKYEGMMLESRFYGPHAYYYWALIFCNCVAPQILWWRKMRTKLPVLYISSIIVSIGMWLERFVIIPMSLERDFLPSSWGLYKPTWVDCTLYLGTFGLFFTMFLLFCRFLPTIAIAEMRELLHHKLMHGHHGSDHSHDHDGGHGTAPAIGEASH